MYDICEARKNEAVGQLKEKITELANELSSCITKLNNKNSELEMMENKYSKLEKVLDENHVLLTEEKTRKEQLFLQVESLTYQLSSK